MRIIATFSLSIFFLFSSCKKDDLLSPQHADNQLTLSGTISNWAFGDSMTIRAQKQIPYVNEGLPIIVGNSKVLSDGSFTLTLTSPPSQFLFPGNSDTSFKSLDVSSLTLLAPSGLPYRQVYNANDSAAIYTLVAGNYFAHFVYANETAHITGIQKSWHGQPPNVDTIFYQADCYFQKGWNRVVQKVISNESHIITQLSTVQNSSDGNWYVAP